MSGLNEQLRKALQSGDSMESLKGALGTLRDVMREIYFNDTVPGLDAFIREGFDAVFPAPAAAPAPVAASTGLMDEIACLNRRIAVMQNELNMRHAKDTGDVWYWQGDGTDDPASMCNVLTVVINAADLRAALAAVPAAAPIVQPVGEPWTAGEALRYAAKVIELYDDATMQGDYMLSSTDCAGILAALADMPIFAAAAPVVQAERVGRTYRDADGYHTRIDGLNFAAGEHADLYAAPTSAAADAKDAALRSAMLAWWEGKRPEGWTEEQHYAIPTVNCNSVTEDKLARAIAAIATSADEVKGGRNE